MFQKAFFIAYQKYFTSMPEKWLFLSQNRHIILGLIKTTMTILIDLTPQWPYIGTHLIAIPVTWQNFRSISQVLSRTGPFFMTVIVLTLLRRSKYFSIGSPWGLKMVPFIWYVVLLDKISGWSIDIWSCYSRF